MITTAEDVKTFVSTFDFITNVRKVKHNSMFGANTVEVEVWANCRAELVRAQLMSALQEKFENTKFNLVFFYNITERGEG
jgi:hypothetical protein